MSPPEARLWNMLRRSPFAEHHFRRQVPLGRYYADFASHTLKLVIEVDGWQHFSDAAERYDAARDAFLKAEGYEVVRLTASEVLNNLDGVGDLLFAKLSPPSTLRVVPPPHEGEGAGQPERPECR
jgi:very-short-patch-repair endonuclease